MEGKAIKGVMYPPQQSSGNETRIDSIDQRRTENDTSIPHLSSDEKIMKNLSSNERASQIQDLAMEHIDPHSKTHLVSQRTDLKPSQSTRPRENQQQEGLACPRCVGTKDDRIYDPVRNLQRPPRAHVRSKSAIPGSVGIHTNKNAYSAAAQFDRRRRVNSQPAFINASRDMPFHSTAQDMWDPSQRFSEDFTTESSNDRVPLLRSVQTHLLPGLGTDDGVNEGRQHIGRHKHLWFLAVAILVGIFLCLFLYAFDIIN
jgi:hypothetical protein